MQSVQLTDYLSSIQGNKCGMVVDIHIACIPLCQRQIISEMNRLSLLIHSQFFKATASHARYR